MSPSVETHAQTHVQTHAFADAFAAVHDNQAFHDGRAPPPPPPKATYAAAAGWRPRPAAPAPNPNGVVRCRDFDPSKLHIAAPNPARTGAAGANYASVYRSADDRQPGVLVQTPSLTVPFDVQTNCVDRDMDPSDPNAVVKDYTLTVSFRDMDSNPDVRDMYDKIVATDARVTSIAVANRAVWFATNPRIRDLDPAACEGILRATLQHMSVKDGATKTYADGNTVTYPPTMKIKMRPTTQVYDEAGRPIDLSAVKKGCVVKVIASARAVWIINARFGCTWNAEQVQVVSSPASRDMTAFAFQPDDDGGAGREGEEEEVEVEVMNGVPLY
jgi:hypothetical protein